MTRSQQAACGWCGRPVDRNAGRMRLHESETSRFSGKTLATFHPECGDALLDQCEERLASKEAA